MPRRVLTLAVVTTAMATLGGKAEAATLTRSESALLRVMNEARASHGLRPLRIDRRLQRAARAHSSSMLRTQTFTHGAYALRIRRTGIRAPRVGENLAWSSGALARARVIVNMWLASPAHRANLLHAGYRTVGVGALKGRFAGCSGALVVTTDFAGR